MLWDTLGRALFRRMIEQAGAAGGRFLIGQLKVRVLGVGVKDYM